MDLATVPPVIGRAAAEEPFPRRKITLFKHFAGLQFIIISPWSKKGFVDHNQYETVSILAFIEGLYNLSPLNMRDANALPPVAAFLGEPDVTKP